MLARFATMADAASDARCAAPGHSRIPARAQGEPVLVASYDARLLMAARALGVELVQL
jgi:hypothetical protein